MMKQIDSDSEEESISVTDEMLPKVENVPDAQVKALTYYCKFYPERQKSKQALAASVNLDQLYEKNVTDLLDSTDHYEKHKYLKKFGVCMDIPYQEVLDAKIC